MNRGEENSETIPLDLVIEILTRLPVKSIARFRCVSKLWESALGSPIFTDSFFNISSSRPKLLFTFVLDGTTMFFSSPQPHNTLSSSLTSSYHMSFPIYLPIDMCRPVHGMVCGSNQMVLKGESVTAPLICNPSTGQSLTLPTILDNVTSFFGYDPVDKQFKVLCIIEKFSKEYQVLTLGTGKDLSWRMIKCDIPHYPLPTEDSQVFYVYDGVCINGFLYYFSSVLGEESYEIVCFDIRSEKFKCIRKAQGMKVTRKSILINYKGKLAMLRPNIVNRVYTGIQLWVQDAEKHQWSSNFYVLPPPWNIIYEEEKLYFVGMTSVGEIVLSPRNVSNSFYLLYYNPERNTIIRVGIQGMEAIKPFTAHIFLDHVEDVKLMTDL